MLLITWYSKEFRFKRVCKLFAWIPFFVIYVAGQCKKDYNSITTMELLTSIASIAKHYKHEYRRSNESTTVSYLRWTDKHDAGDAATVHVIITLQYQQCVEWSRVSVGGAIAMQLNICSNFDAGGHWIAQSTPSCLVYGQVSCKQYRKYNWQGVLIKKFVCTIILSLAFSFLRWCSERGRGNEGEKVILVLNCRSINSSTAPWRRSDANSEMFIWTICIRRA